ITLRLKNGKNDERLASARLLGRFGGELIAIDALLDTNFQELGAEEFQARVTSLGHADVLADKVSETLFSNLDYYLDEKRPRTPDNVLRIQSLLGAVANLSKPAAPGVAEKVKDLVDDFRTDIGIKR